MPTTTPQHLSALTIANAIRLERAAYRRHLRQLPNGPSAEALAELLEADELPRWITSAMIVDVLTWPTRWGLSRAKRALRKATGQLPYAGVSEHRRVGDLSDRERFAIAGQLRTVPLTS